MTEARILVVDDEPKLVRLVREVLTATRYAVMSTGSGENAVEMAALERPDLILLDIVLSGAMDGYEVARRVREFSDVPIIMLTAKARESDLLHGFDVGADDYLTKPFGGRALQARIEAVLRRYRPGAPLTTERTQFQSGPLCVDVANRQVTLNDAPVYLTPIEFALLTELIRYPDKVRLHGELLTAVWGPEYRDDVTILRATIYRLRQKIEPDPASPSFIQTEPGVGYIFS